jgi:hypothetical protein
MLSRLGRLWRKSTSASTSAHETPAIEPTEPPPLGGTRRDTAVTVAKGVVGTIPFVGSIISEIVTTVIPQQRIERLESYVRYLNDRLAGDVDDGLLKERLRAPEYIDLFEEGAIQSARALSEERRNHIAELVASGISGDEKERIETKRLLRLLEEIDDDQIIILTSYLRKNRGNDEFFGKHKAVLETPRAHVELYA